MSVNDGLEKSFPGVGRSFGRDGKSGFACGCGSDGADGREFEAGLPEFLFDRVREEACDASCDRGAAEGNPVEFIPFEGKKYFGGPVGEIFVPVDDDFFQFRSGFAQFVGEDITPAVGTCPEDAFSLDMRGEDVGESFCAIGSRDEICTKSKRFERGGSSGTDGRDFYGTERAGIGTSLPESREQRLRSVGTGEDEPIESRESIKSGINLLPRFGWQDFDDGHEERLGAEFVNAIEEGMLLRRGSRNSETEAEEGTLFEPCDRIAQGDALSDDDERGGNELR